MFSSPHPSPQPHNAVTGEVAKAGLVSKLKKVREHNGNSLILQRLSAARH
jgi:hypothetical protein